MGVSLNSLEHKGELHSPGSLKNSAAVYGFQLKAPGLHTYNSTTKLSEFGKVAHGYGKPPLPRMISHSSSDDLTSYMGSSDGESSEGESQRVHDSANHEIISNGVQVVDARNLHDNHDELQAKGRSGSTEESETEDDDENEEEENVKWDYPDDKMSSQDTNYGVDARDQGTADEWIKRHPSLVRLTGRYPFNCEPPLSSLRDHGFITPAALHYVRNHGYVPRGDWDEWKVEVSGLVKWPTTLTMHDLLTKFPQREFPCTLVCAGNRRKEQNMTSKTIGFNWGAAGVSTNVWKGVRLCEVLRYCGVMSKKKGAHYVCFEGAETLPAAGGTKYGTSVTIEKAMDEAQDIILAYQQNGRRLLPDHGYPLRMIIPGHIGGRMVKWVRSLTVTPEESKNHYHYNDNRVLPSHVDAETAKAEGWFYKPDYIINELNINSAITTPAHNEILPFESILKPYAVKGYAYTGGGRKVTRVEISLDSGETWRMCNIDRPEPPTKHGKYWCWVLWDLDVEVTDFLQSKELVVRAWDSALNTQGDRLTWNVMGMMNNCWFRVKVHVCKTPSGGVGLNFEHPTCPGNEAGGWMAKQKGADQPAEPVAAKKTLTKSVSTPSLGTVQALARQIPMSEVGKHVDSKSAWIVYHGSVYDCTEFLQEHPGGADSILLAAGTDATEEFDAIHSDKAKAMLDKYKVGDLMSDSERDIPMSEVRKHVDSKSAWIVYHGSVYDCTGFLQDHPGGADSILLTAGTDATEEFDAIHSHKAKAMLDKYKVGNLMSDSEHDSYSATSTPDSSLRGGSHFTHLSTISESPPATGNPVALNPKERIPFQLIEKVRLSSDVCKLRFALQSKDHILGLPVGKHVFIAANINNRLVMRAYTPTSCDKDVGFFDLLVKIYHKSENYPSGGLMSQYLNGLKVGESIMVKGPTGHIHYQGKGLFEVNHIAKQGKKFAMIAGGTGITPIYQVVRAILEDPDDHTEVSLIYCNRMEEDIMLKDQLDRWQEQHSNFHVWYTLSGSQVREDWKYSIGRITEQMMREHLPLGGSDTFAFLCGPPALESTSLGTFEKMGYDRKGCFSF